MAEPAGPVPRPRLELSLPEARTRFVQLARLASLTHQTTIVTDGGRPLAAIVPASRSGPPAEAVTPGQPIDAVLPGGSGEGVAPGRSSGVVAPGGPGEGVTSGRLAGMVAPGRSADSVAPASGGPGASPSSGGVGASRPSADVGASGSSAGGAPKGSAAGWLRRIETLRAELQRQHTALELALEEAWRELDRVRPPGSDDAIDSLRLAHSDVRRTR